MASSAERSLELARRLGIAFSTAELLELAEDERGALELFAAPAPVLEDADTVRPPDGGAGPASPGSSRTLALEQRALRRLGPYLLLEEIGRGGMGVVFRAFDPRLDRECAIKVIRPDLGTPAAWRASRFHREARALARLGRHKNIVPLFEMAEEEEEPYIVMAFAPGRALDRLIEGGVLEPLRAARIAQKVAEGLDHAHRRGIIHRDVKPANVIVDDRDEPMVTDFGLAKDIEVEAISQSGSVIGTPAYMAPEQAGGGDAPVDARSDVYSLGAVLYHALCGRPPFEGASVAATVTSVLHDTPPSPRKLRPAIPQDLETIALKCLDRDPAGRYPTAAALAKDLGAFAEGRPISARPPGLRDVTRALVRRHRAVAAVAAIAIAVGLAGAVAGIARLRVERDRAEDARQLAERETERAARRERVARGALDVMIGKVKDHLGDLPGESLRRVRQALLEKALEGVAQLGATRELTLAACEASMQEGQLAIAAGNTKRAREAFERAVATARGVAKGTPGEPVAEREVASALLELAQLDFALGAYGAAGASLEEAIARTRPLTGTAEPLDPRAPNPRDLLPGLLYLLGNTRLARDDLAGAAAAIGEAVALARDRPESSRNPREASRTLAAALLEQGRVRGARGDLAGARAPLVEAAAILREAVARDPKSVRARSDLLMAISTLSDVLAKRGERDEAMKALEESVSLARRLHDEDRASATFGRGLATALSNLADLRDTIADHAGAVDAEREAAAITRELIARDPANTIASRDLVPLVYNLAAMLERAGDPTGARQAFSESVDLARALFDAGRRDEDRTVLALMLGDGGTHVEPVTAVAMAREALALERGVSTPTAQTRIELTDIEADLGDALERAGASAPTTAADELALAYSSCRRSDWPTAVSRFARALEDPAVRDDPVVPNFANAASAAALASVSKEGEAARSLRQRAIEWLRLDLDWTRQTFGEAGVRERLEQIRREDESLASLRGTPELERLLAAVADPGKDAAPDRSGHGSR